MVKAKKVAVSEVSKSVESIVDSTNVTQVQEQPMSVVAPSPKAKKTSTKAAQNTKKNPSVKKTNPVKSANTAKKAKVAAGSNKTIRLRVFECLNKTDEMTGKAIAEAVGVNGIPSLLLHEVGYGRLARAKYETGPTQYKLTAKGRKALKDNTVDSDPAPVVSADKVP